MSQCPHPIPRPREVGKISSALSHQEGGNHYKDLAIQPVEYITRNKMGFIEGSVVKYVTRHRLKNGAEDIRKAIHFLHQLLELEYPAVQKVMKKQEERE